MTGEHGLSFGQMLRRYRLAAGLSHEALAERAGLSARGISDLERGVRRAPHPETVALLADALGFAPQERAALEATVERRRRPRSTRELAPADTAAPPPARPRDVPPLTALERPRHNLPFHLTSFVGRMQEMTEASRLLAETRLLTLTGPGGVGKTRLALQVAAARLERYPDGVWLVELAPLADPALVPQAIATVLGLREDAGYPLTATLVETLRPRTLLLVLDNCEHLIDGCARLADTLLRAIPGLRVLATSREALGIAGESIYAVPALRVPAAADLPLNTLQASDAVRLFTERAQAVHPPFALTPANAPRVVELCQRLDGIPLALEMAAARVRGLSVDQLAARLDQRLRLLTRGSRAALPRQQTLRATVDWSYDLLSPAEQTLFQRLSVFAGGWMLEAAEAICADGSVAREEVLDLLLRLVDKSLVVAEEDQSGTRYRLLETLRHYGRERVVVSGEAAHLHRRHAAYYTALAERAEPALHGPAQGRWLDDLEREYSNLRAALAWCLGPAERLRSAEDAVEAVETGMRLASALQFFWWLRQHLREGQAWLQRALTHGGGAPAALQAKTLVVAGDMAGELGDLAQAQALIAQGVALYRAHGPTKDLAVALSFLGTWTWRGGSAQRGMAVLEEAQACARDAGDPWALAWALIWMTYGVATSAAIQSPAARLRARAAGEESLALFDAVGDTKNIAWTQQWLGHIALHEGEYGRARAAFTAELAPLRALGDRIGLSVALAGLGDAARAQGHGAAAVALYEESLAVCQELGYLVTHTAAIFSHLGEIALDQGNTKVAQAHLAAALRVAQLPRPDARWWLADVLDGYGALAAAQDAPQRALRLARAATALREQGLRPLAPHEQLIRERRLAPIRQALSSAEQAAAWAEGQVLTWEQALAYALEQPASY